MKYLSLIIILACLQACGSVTTLTKTDPSISDKLYERGTYCESIPRVYSGVSYDFCMLHAKPVNMAVDLVLGFYLVDGFLSAVTDTVALPYTIPLQLNKGNIDISL